jgi:hypothetical protein
MGTKARLVPVSEYGVMTAAPGHRLHVVLAHRAEQVPAEAAPATRRLRMSGAG